MDNFRQPFSSQSAPESQRMDITDRNIARAVFQEWTRLRVNRANDRPLSPADLSGRTDEDMDGVLAWFAANAAQLAQRRACSIDFDDNEDSVSGGFPAPRRTALPDETVRRTEQHARRVNSVPAPQTKGLLAKTRKVKKRKRGEITWDASVSDETSSGLDGKAYRRLFVEAHMGLDDEAGADKDVAEDLGTAMEEGDLIHPDDGLSYAGLDEDGAFSASGLGGHALSDLFGDEGDFLSTVDCAAPMHGGGELSTEGEWRDRLRPRWR